MMELEQLLVFFVGTEAFYALFDKPKSKSQIQAQIEKGKRNLDSGLSLKSYGPTNNPPPHPKLLSMS